LDLNALHYNSLVFDAHCDFLNEAVSNDRQFNIRAPERHLDLPRLLEGGVAAQIFALFAVCEDVSGKRRTDPTAEALRQMEAFYAMADTNKDQFLVATSAQDVERAKAVGKVAGILSMEGVEPLVGDIRLLRFFFRLGVRNVGLTWNFSNEAGDGVEVSDAGGLTEFGRRVVTECGKLGIMVDIAHLSSAGVEDVLHLADGPIIDSHANAFSICPHPRNLKDTQLDGVAASGGVVCVTFVPQFVAAEAADASLEGVLDHIDYIVERIGIDHVGLGSDFEGYDGTTAGLTDVTRLPLLTEGLQVRGYAEEGIRKILGLNLLRVFRQVAG
jgi:membrane dipeptidase